MTNSSTHSTTLRVNNFDKYLHGLFTKRKTSVLPDDSFVTYLGNKLKFECAILYQKKIKTRPAFFLTFPPFFSSRLAFAFLSIFFIIASAFIYFSKIKPVNQLAYFDTSIANIENDLKFLDKETEEADITIEETTIEQELESVMKL